MSLVQISVVGGNYRIRSRCTGRVRLSIFRDFSWVVSYSALTYDNLAADIEGTLHGKISFEKHLPVR